MGVGSALKDVVAYEVKFEDFLSVVFATINLQEFKFEVTHSE